jgi:Spy/CpxP family protein refolding chaperone
MRYFQPSLLALAGAAVLITATAATQNRSSHPGDVIQTIPPPVSQSVTPPALKLSDDQRAKIKQVLAAHHTQVTFALKSTQSARGFNPTVGAKHLRAAAAADL